MRYRKKDCSFACVYLFSCLTVNGPAVIGIMLIRFRVRVRVSFKNDINVWLLILEKQLPS